MNYVLVANDFAVIAVVFLEYAGIIVTVVRNPNKYRSKAKIQKRVRINLYNNEV